MQASSSAASAALLKTDDTTLVDGATSAVSWGPILAGAFAAVTLSVVLFALGSGLGLHAVSPWSNSGASAASFTIMTGIWVIVVQWLSSGLGGYMTGRLRTRLVRVHTDEVYFRDSAHGFLAWAVASIIAVAIVSSAVTSLIGGGTQAVGSVATSAVQGASQGAAASSSDDGSNPMAYFTDRLFRSDTPAEDGERDMTGEASRILINSIKSGELPPADRTYLAQLVASRTGISQADAERRVDEVVASAKDAEMKLREAADTARKAAANLSLFTAISMLIGAFIAAAAAVVGGQHRDEWETHLAGHR